MTSDQLLAIVRTLPENTPTLSKLEQQLGVGPGQGRAWYPSQKVHWVRWLAEYQTAGPYSRKARKQNKARTVYNRLMCPPMIYWLPEALNYQECILRSAFRAALNAPKNGASQSAAIRRQIPWKTVEDLIRENPDFRDVLDLGEAKTYPSTG